MKALILVAMIIPTCVEARPGWSLGSLSSKLTDRTGIAARLGADTSTEDQAEVGVNHKISKDVDVGAQLHADRDGKLKGEVNGGVQVDERTRIAAKYDGNAEVGAGRQLNENLGLNARAQRGEDGETQVGIGGDLDLGGGQKLSLKYNANGNDPLKGRFGVQLK